MDSFIDTVGVVSTKKWVLAIEIVGIFLVPVTLIKIGVIPLVYRMYVLGAVAVFVVLLMFFHKWTRRNIGLATNITPAEVVAYVGFTLAGIVMISQFGELIGHEELASWWKYPHFLYLFLIVSFIQEFLYRGYLMPALARLTQSRTTLIVINTLLFTYLHVIFPNPAVGLPLAFIGGFGFALMYLKYPNLLLIALSHAALNFTAVLFGFFRITGF